MFLNKTFIAFVFLLTVAATARSEANFQVGADWLNTRTSYPVGSAGFAKYSGISESDNIANRGEFYIKSYGTFDLSRSQDLTLTYAAQYSTYKDEWAIDKAYLGWKFGEFIGVRVGVVPYKINWCSTYDFNSVWINHPDLNCASNPLVTNYYSDISKGAPGASLYYENVFGDWSLESSIGAYAPRVLGYNTYENSVFGRTSFRGFEQTSSSKFGFSQNFLNLRSGTEVRFGYLHTNLGMVSQEMRSDTGSNSNNAIFIGLGQQLNESLGVILTATQTAGTLKENTMNADGSYSQPYLQKIYSVELDYSLTPRDEFSFFASRSVLNIDLNIPMASVSYAYSQIPSTNYSIAYRHNFDYGIFAGVQLQKIIPSATQNANAALEIDQLSSTTNINRVFVRLGVNF